MAQKETLDGETALITGASAGIGREAAVALAEQGADVVLAARRIDQMRDIATRIEAEHDVDAVSVETDVSEEAAVEALVETTVETFGGLDIVVSNAGTGTGPGIAVEDLPTEQYRTVTDTNIDGMFFTARASIPHLKASSGTLVFVGSFAANYPRPGSPVYAASKWWVRGFALSLAGQVGDEGIGVSVVHPSEVRTEFGKEFRDEAELSKNRYSSDVVTDPEEVAQAIVFAAEQKSPNAVTELDLYRRDKFEGF